MGASVTIGRPGQFREFEQHVVRELEGAALRASAKAGRRATLEVRQAMRAAGLGKLANAIGGGSDQDKSGTVHRRGADSFSASGWVHIRGNSKRTVGAIEAYTQGAEIGPRRGRWLAVPTDRIPQRAGRQPMTPALYKSTGLEERLGRLRFIPGKSPRQALLIIEGVSVDKFGRTEKRRQRLAKRAPKSGRFGPTRAAATVIAFVLIRRTRRAARFDPAKIIAANVAALPALLAAELAKES